MAVDKKQAGKAQLIRDHCLQNPKAGPTAVVEALAAKGVEVSAHYVSKTMARERRPKATTSKKATATKEKAATKKRATSKKKASKPKKSSKKRGSDKKQKSLGRPTAKYPRHSLEQALRIPRAILDQNAGHPCTLGQAAAFVGVGNLGPFRLDFS